MRRLLIAGAGIGGLALACALRDTEWSIEISERADEFKPLGVGIVLHPNGMRALARLSLADQVVAAGNPLRSMEILRDGVVRSLPLADVWTGLAHATISIPRPELHRILASAATAGGRCRVTMGREVIAVEHREARPRVQFSDGTVTAYDLVVGADGVHSALRRSIDPQATAVSTGLYYVRFPARNVIGLAAEVWRTIEQADASHGFIPLPDGQLHCFVQLRRPDPALLDAVAHEAALAQLCRRDPALEQAFAARCGAIHRHPAYIVRPVTWGTDTCVLLGDAAHAVSPTLSEGGSLAMEDALILAQALGDGGGDAQRAVAAYRAARRHPIAWAHRMSLAQVNAARRDRTPTWSISAHEAVCHMREMYEPLRVDPFIALSLPDRSV